MTADTKLYAVAIADMFEGSNTITFVGATSDLGAATAALIADDLSAPTYEHGCNTIEELKDLVFSWDKILTVELVPTTLIL